MEHVVGILFVIGWLLWLLISAVGPFILGCVICGAAFWIACDVLGVK